MAGTIEIMHHENMYAHSRSLSGERVNPAEGAA